MAALSIIACVIVVKVGVLGKRDDRRPDYEFLTTLHEAMPPGSLLISTGGEEIARHIFVSRVPVVGVWEPKDVGKHVGNETIFYVVTPKRNAPELEPLGTVTVLRQSSFSRGERSAEDRLTLFRSRTHGLTGNWKRRLDCVTVRRTFAGYGELSPD